jgi:ribosomal small subunit protein bTHX
MGKGDKKTRRGKIILGTYGVRRRRKKADKPEIKHVNIPQEKALKDKKPHREKKEIPAIKEVVEIKEVKEVKEITPVKETREVKEVKEPKPSKPAKEVREPKPAGNPEIGSRKLRNPGSKEK